MTFALPALLFAAFAIPLIWLILRARPPSPETRSFPPVALLARLSPSRPQSAKPPVLLFLLRALALACVIIGLAGPFIPGTRLTLGGTGNILLVLDDGMMSAPGWNERISAMNSILDDAARMHRNIVFLRTADLTEEDEHPALLKARAATEVSHDLETLRPSAWPSDRALATKRLLKLGDANIGTVVYLSDGIASAADDMFRTALQKSGQVSEIRPAGYRPVVLAPSAQRNDKALARLITLPATETTRMRVRARDRTGGTLAVADVSLPPDNRETQILMPDLPSVMRNQIDTLTVDGQASVPSVLIFDDGDRLRPVGLLTTGGGDTPLIGSQFYLRRALSSAAELQTGSVDSLLSRPLSVLIAPDGTLSGPDIRQRVAAWVKNGGTLIRFAGTTLSAGQENMTEEPEQADKPCPAEQTLLPVCLMAGSRQLGGAMSWGSPQPLAPFAADSVFHDLAIPKDVTVSRQVLARPASDLNTHTWARLADGTPLVTHISLGKGEIVLFHVTATADWSNLPLSGLFVSMLERLSDRANGVEIPSDTTILAPVLTLDGDGIPGAAPPQAKGLPASAFGSTPVSRAHPAGLYGSSASRRALNAGATLTRLDPEKLSGSLSDTSRHHPDRKYGQFFLIAAFLLLLADQMIMLAARLRLSLKRRHLAALALIPLMVLPYSGHAQDSTAAPPADTPAQNHPDVPPAAISTRLAYVITGNDETDTASRQGLQGLSTYVNARTSASLGPPDGVHPGTDDLSFYPLLYWPVRPDAEVTPAFTSALTSFMAHGGILMIDTQRTEDDSASPALLRKVTAGLPVPALKHLDDHHVLAHTFYLLHDFPGRYAGRPVWVAKEGDTGNDEVSPVIIGSADWARAWATDSAGDTLFALFPGGDDQRQAACRFGVNAVIYALTGNYKGDQVHVPEILKRLGE
ncbi:DUF4159 domain-containing protein [Acetobacter sp. AN02]|uniref:DUF4159 domain-containing protein n=1 Tax=Acetobacter sp. AN02 TaxID=2894186 RepID=UPI0024343782|nr:DUF4159 domain-containing protein [Acetobacter sp. AN02]MDG6094428.1 DUF4159 domain-containing protein [Acetobacter sp. AN02]